MSLKTIFRFLVVALIFIALAILVTVHFYVAPWLKEKLVTAVREVCETCHLQIDDLSLTVFTPGDVTIEGVKFYTGEKGATEVQADIRSISFHVSLRQAWNRRVRIRNLYIAGFDITVIDGDKRSPPATPKKTGEPIPISIAPSQFSYGDFKYVRNHEGTSATVHVHQIEGSLSAINPQSDALIHGELSARYETTGSARLSVSTNPFKKPLEAEVELKVKDQDLHDLTLFFEPNAGVIIQGKIIEGTGHVSLNGDEIKATDWIVYENLESKVKKDKDRNGIEAFFTNLGMGLTMQTKNTELQPPEQTKSVSLKREDNESTISFILRGLKEAAMKIASRSNTPP